MRPSESVPSTRIIAGREIGESLRSRTFWIMTAITALSVVALIVVPGLVDRPERPPVIGLAGAPAQSLGPSLRTVAEAAGVQVKVVDAPDVRTARAQVRAGDLDVALSLERDGEGAAVAEVKESLAPEVAALVRMVLDNAHRRRALEEAGVPPATVARVLAPVTLRMVALEPPPSDRAARSVAAVAAGILLYVTLSLYATAVSSGVAQEKTSRTAEVLLAAARPTQLLNGKVLGIGACGLGQMGITVAAGLIANAFAGSARVPATVWTLLPTILVWFVLGFALYAFGFAAAGAMVARQEELSSVTLPITMPLLAAFMLDFVAMDSPDVWWNRVLSFVPPFAPILMPTRLALGHLAAWEMPLAVAIMLASVYGAARLAARIYAGAIVRGGACLGWRDALRLRAFSG